MRVVLSFLVVAALCSLPRSAPPLAAQVEATPVLRGAVRMGAGAVGRVPDGVEEETITLHRVTPDTAGEIATTSPDADGSFSFRLPSVPDPGGRGDLYFASVEYRGILYFGEPVATAIQLDSLYLIEVHDTVAAPPGGAGLPVAIRYLVMEEAEAPAGAPVEQGGGWRVTDLIQVRNDGDRTLVAAEGESVWTYPLPPQASRVQVGGGDVGPDAARFAEGRLRVQAPIPPGQRQFILRYALASPEMSVPLPGVTEAVELLVREPAPSLRVDGLDPAEPAAMESGITYRRYVGGDLSDVTLEVREGEEQGRGLGMTPRWIAVLMALLLGGVGVWAAMRPRPDTGRATPPPEGVSPPSHPDPGARRGLVLEIARIDEALEGGVDAAEETRLRERRRELVERLKATG